MKNLHPYIEMTSPELEQLDRDRTVVFSSISPIETHGEHLPLGTDLFIAESVRDRIIERLLENRRDYHALVLPTLSLGANAIPVSGSVPIRHKAIYFALRDTGRTLADLGFRYWVITDNHGGPLHQIAIEEAGRKLARRNLLVIAPFHELFRRMVNQDPDLLQKTGLPAEHCGAPEDSHAGTNETSLMLSLHPEKVRDSWKKIGPGKRSPMKAPFRLLSGLSRLLAATGLRDASTDLYFLSQALAWVSDKDMESYQGNPSMASPAAGDAMFIYHVDVGVGLLEKAIAGTYKGLKPMGWSLRGLRFFMLGP